MDLLSLEYLRAFDTYGTLSEAANQLHISQSALSRSMQKLENELGLSLFVRTRNSITLNETGKMAVRYASHILSEAESMKAALTLFDRETHTITIGAIAPSPLWYMPSACSTVFPEMSVSTEIKDETTLLQGLFARNTYKLIFLPYKLNDDRVDSFPYLREDLMITMPTNHPLAKRKKISFSEVDGETFIVATNIGFWEDIHQRNLPNSHFVYQERREDISALINRSNLLTFSTNLSIDHHHTDLNRSHVPLSDDDAHVVFYCTWMKRSEKELAPLLTYLKSHTRLD